MAATKLIYTVLFNWPNEDFLWCECEAHRPNLHGPEFYEVKILKNDRNRDAAPGTILAIIEPNKNPQKL